MVKTKIYRFLATSLLIAVFSGFGFSRAEEFTQGKPPKATAAEAAVAFAEVPYLERAFLDFSPESEDEALAVGALDNDGGKKTKIQQLAQEIEEGKHGLIDSLLIMHNGKLLFESYYRRGRVDLPHEQASITKAYTSLIVGRAIQMGYLTLSDLHKPLINFFEDLDTTNFVDGIERITLHKAMTMRSGLRIDIETIEDLEKTPETIKGALQLQRYFELSEPITEENQTFYYHFNDLQLVMQVLEIVVPGTVSDFIENEVLGGLGIDSFYWREDFNSLPVGYSGSRMTSRDMVKWGLLIRNKGRWNGEQLIPEKFVANVVDRIVRFDDDNAFEAGEKVTNPGYGYYWFQADMVVNNESYFTTSAQGADGQYIFVIPEADMVVVATAHESDDAIMRLTAERILPVFIDG